MRKLKVIKLKNGLYKKMNGHICDYNYLNNLSLEKNVVIDILQEF